MWMDGANNEIKRKGVSNAAEELLGVGFFCEVALLRTRRRRRNNDTLPSLCLIWISHTASDWDSQSGTGREVLGRRLDCGSLRNRK